MRGDYAVPTLFNGNFDAIYPRYLEGGDSLAQPIPGWFDPDRSNTTQTFLEHNIAGNDSYALELGDGLDEITHNPFIVPDWGALRFDLHTPSLSGGGQLKVSITSSTNPSEGEEETIFLDQALNDTEIVVSPQGRDINLPGSYEEDKYRIGYGEEGWESFYIDVPEYLRGKTATLKFELVGSDLIYLDNVFFKSDALNFGNPTEARKELFTHEKNYLVEKPQYSISYNSDKNIPNWVGWRLNDSWLGDKRREPFFGFAEDSDLFDTGFYLVDQLDYYFDDYGYLDPIDKVILDPVRGHLSPAVDRSRDKKDLYATFLTTNIVPQETRVNGGLWLSLENKLRRDAQGGVEYYIFAGGRGTSPYHEGSLPARGSLIGDETEYITIPERTWKVVLGFNENSNSRSPEIAFAVDVPNNSADTIGMSWTDYKISVGELESRLNSESRSNGFIYDFLSEIPNRSVRDNLRNNIIDPLS